MRADGGTRQPRSILLTVGLAVLTIAAGLASRRYSDVLPVFLAQYAGDALWAAVVFWLLAMFWRRAGAARLALAALAVAVAVEASQLFHPVWLDSLRATTIGAWLLGHGFLWSDLACYVGGVALAVGLDVAIARTHAFWKRRTG